ncbi:hypothetical protein Tco_1417116, partial [Tanacetum coccineum]
MKSRDFNKELMSVFMKHGNRFNDLLSGHDRLNSACGGNFLDKMPRDCLRIIESKSKVRNSRNKPVVAKVSASTSTPEISSEVAELKDMVVQPPAYQAPTYQAPAPQIQGVSKEDFQAYVKANDAVMRNMQTQDVYEGEITLRVGREAITFNLDQTSRYTANYNHMTANRIDVIDMDTLKKFLVSQIDFLLFEEADYFLAIEDDPTSLEVDPTYYDPDGNILLLEAILNSEPPPPLQGNYFPETR